jgi:chitinase
MLKLAALVAAALSSGIGMSGAAMAAPGSPTLAGYEINTWGKSYGFVEVSSSISGAEAYKDLVKLNDQVDVPLPFNIWYGANAVKAYAVVDGVRDDGSMVPMTPGQTKAAPVAHPASAGKKKMQVDVCDAEGNCARSDVVEVVVFDTVPEMAGDLPDNSAPHTVHKIPKGIVVGTYFPTWGIYDRKFDVSKVPVDNLTHILYGFVPICGDTLNASLAPQQMTALKRSCAGLPDYSVAVHDIWGEIGKKDLPGATANLGGVMGQMMAAKKRNPDLKILPSIGGWTLSDPYYGLGVAANRKVFIDSVENFLTTWKFFDGVDIDWEYPGGGGANPNLGNKATDGDTYVVLMKELRDMLARLGKKTGKTYQLTSAIGAAQVHIADIDYKKATQYMDYLFDMTYDFSGAWTMTGLGHLAGLNVPSWMADDPAKSFSTRNSVNALLAQGIDPKKLVVGAAMYGRGWTGVSDMTDTKNPFTGTAKSPLPINNAQFAWENGIIDYRGLKQFMLGADNKGINGYTVGYDAKAEAPYVFNPSDGTLVTYDNARSVIAKGNFVRDNKLGGLFSWEITGDTGDILEAMHKGLDHPEGGGGDQPKAPTANAGEDGVIMPLPPGEKSWIWLDGSDSVNPQSDTLKYHWEQISGATLEMTTPDAARARITVPSAATDTLYVFKLTVTNAANLSSSSNITITQKGSGSHETVPPQIIGLSSAATIGANETGTVKVKVKPVAGQKLEYQWSAPGLTLTGDGATANFVAPELAADRDFVVTVVVSNSKGSDTATIRIKVLKKEGGGQPDPDVPAYPAGMPYKAGQVVSNNGKNYVCNIPGWCNSNSAMYYAPGTGLAWDSAWSEKK